jgi:hypothetical protein
MHSRCVLARSHILAGRNPVSVVKDNSCKIKDALFKSANALLRVLNKIIGLIFSNAIKSKKYVI